MKQSASSPYVVITGKHDAHLPFVQKHLDHKLLVLDPEDVLSGQAMLSYRLESGRQPGRLRMYYNDVLLDGVRAVWYRKPNFKVSDQLQRVDSTFKEYSQSAMEQHVRSLIAQFGDALWISDYAALLYANHKSLQLRVASQLGFRMPETLMTNDPDAVRSFAKRYKTLIVKSQASNFPAQDNVARFFFAQVVPSKTLLERLDNLHLAPAIFQQHIATTSDIRVTVVGGQCFAASITTEDKAVNDTTVRDWRSAHSQRHAKFVQHDLPQREQELCIKLVHRLGLRYGAIDLVVGHDGRYWFLEINPNGQWAFVEEDCGLPIGKAIADLLASARH
jgi:glutathione synthase/RimK-type ligase-like ATP-grasp enzyme